MTGFQRQHFWGDLFTLLLVSGVIVALDQWTKMLVRNSLEYAEAWDKMDWLAPYARIVHWHNSGVAFGLFQQAGKSFSVLPILVSLVIIYYFFQVPRHEWPLRLAMGMQLGGAVGNLIDRLRFGYVTDFISVGNFPVFNIADSSVSVGVAVLILAVWLEERKAKQQAGQEQGDDDNTQPEEVSAGD